MMSKLKEKLLRGVVSKLRLQPGDKIVISSKEHLSAIAGERIRGALEQFAPGHDVLILSGGMKIEVLRGLEAGQQQVAATRVI